MRHMRWLELIKDYYCIINYDLGSKNIVTDFFNWKIKVVMEDSGKWNKGNVMKLKKIEVELGISPIISLLAQVRVWFVFKDEVL